MASKIRAKGTTLQIKLTGTFTTIGQRVSLNPPDVQVKIVETTDLDSTYVEKKPSIPDLGKLSGTLFYDPADSTHAAMRARVVAPPAAIDEFKLNWTGDGNTTPASETVKGWLTKFTPTNVEREGYVQAEFEIDLSDSYTFAAGTP